MLKEKNKQLIEKIKFELLKINESIGKLNEKEVELKIQIKKQKSLSMKKSPLINDVGFISSLTAMFLISDVCLKSFFAGIAACHLYKMVKTRIDNKKAIKTQGELKTNEMHLNEINDARNHLAFRRNFLMNEMENVKNGNTDVLGL